MAKNKITDIPGEVFQVWSIIRYQVPVGTETYNHCQKIIDKYPEHFPWEHKYKTVPEEVHEAYRKEMGYDYGSLLLKMPKFDDVPEGGGIFAEMKKMLDAQEKQKEEDKDKPLSQLWTEMFDALGKQEDEARKQALYHASVWNKHYKKYRLEFRPNPYERKFI